MKLDELSQLNLDEDTKSIFKYIEIFYNRIRIHSYLGGLSPCQYEMKMAA